MVSVRCCGSGRHRFGGLAWRLGRHGMPSRFYTGTECLIADIIEMPTQNSFETHFFDDYQNTTSLVSVCNPTYFRMETYVDGSHNELERATTEVAINCHLSRMRPTTVVAPDLQRLTMPLRLLDCARLAEFNDISFVTPFDWNFVMISHVWSSVDPRVAYPRSYPAQGGMEVKAASQNAVQSMARLSLTEGYLYAWIDCLCIDQESSLEKSREILNMTTITPGLTP